MGIPCQVSLSLVFIMKLLIVASLIALAAGASVGRNQEWEEFKVKFGKGFRDLKHESQRRAVFESNLNLIEAHNQNSKKDYLHTKWELISSLICLTKNFQMQC